MTSVRVVGMRRTYDVDVSSRIIAWASSVTISGDGRRSAVGALPAIGRDGGLGWDSLEGRGGADGRAADMDASSTGVRSTRRRRRFRRARTRSLATPSPAGNLTTFACDNA